MDAAQIDKRSKVGHLCTTAERGGGRVAAKSADSREEEGFAADCPRDRLGMEGCGEGRHEERQEEGGAPALPVQMRLKLLFARVRREEKPNTPQKCEKRRSGSVRGGGGVHIVYT